MNLRTRLQGVIDPEAAAEAVEICCHACGASGMIAFYEVAGVPAQTCVLLDTREQAAGFPIGDVLLAYCDSCGFIQNSRFDSTLVDYSMPTEESQSCSPTFSEFAACLADELTQRHHLKGKRVLEVGCGKGDFLRLLAERGIGVGLGIDPGYLPNRVSRPEGELQFVRGWYAAGETHHTADFVLTRHLMEHVPNVAEFFGWLRQSVAATPGATLFTEVPDVGRVLDEGAFWDVYYEHCSYFTPDSLARCLSQAGLEVEWLELGFDNQYILAGAVPREGPIEPPHEDYDLRDFASSVETFTESVVERLQFWRSHIEAVIGDGGSVAVWGGGSKAVAFLSSVSIPGVTVVDINPYKQGKWLPGVAVEVQPPVVLAGSRPDLVIPMNPVYAEEIREDLARMGLSPRLIPVTGG